MAEHIIEVAEGPNLRLLPCVNSKGKQLFSIVERDASGNPKIDPESNLPRQAWSTKVAADTFGGGLPEQVEFQGDVLVLDDTTPTKKHNHPKRAGRATVEVDGKAHSLNVCFTQSVDGTVNVTASLREVQPKAAKVAAVTNGAIG